MRPGMRRDLAGRGGGRVDSEHSQWGAKLAMSSRVVVIGGGLAGLAATCALAERGLRVTLLESRPRLGGRATSFVDQHTGELIDNCQHVAMQCCTNYLDFCRRTGLADRLAPQPRLHFIGDDCRPRDFSAVRLPAPLHLLPALRQLPDLTGTDRRQLSRAVRALCRTREFSDGPFSEWLRQQGQSPALCERFWQVILVSALSETLDRIDFGHARKVIVDGFLANREAWTVVIPTVPLHDLYGQQLSEWFGRRQVDVRLSTSVRQLVVADGRVVAAELRTGERVTADAFVLAVPWHRFAGLAPAEVAAHKDFAAVARIPSAPITGVHLWFDRPIMELPHAVLVNRLSQWVFNRQKLWTGGRTLSDAGRHYYQVVISASRAVQGVPHSTILERVTDELADIWPAAASARRVHGRVVVEHRAVFSVKPGIDALRPPQATALPNLQVAGDWTRTDWPATMEGAVRSGYLAAANLLRQLGCDDRVLQPDLPVAGLAKLLLRV